MGNRVILFGDKDGDHDGGSPSKFRFFPSHASSNSQHQHGQPQQPPQPNGILRNSYDHDTLSRVGQRLASNATVPAATTYSPGNNNNNVSSHHNTSIETNHYPPQPLPKPGWRPQPQSQQQQTQHQQQQQEEEAIPNDSLYGNGHDNQIRQSQQYGSRPSLSGNMAHWSSHGYLAKPNATDPPVGSPNSATLQNRMMAADSGYVLLKRQGDQMVTVHSPNGTLQPQSLPIGMSRPPQQYHSAESHQPQQQDPDRKYFSVKGMSDMRTKHPQESMDKYYSVDARYNSVKHLPQDLKAKLRQVHEAQQQQRLRQLNEQQQQQPPYLHPHHAPYGQQQNPPVPPPRQPSSLPIEESSVQQSKPQPMTSSSSLEKSKQMSGSVSWLEWTQQLQAYVAWVNSQLRKRPDLKPVTDLRTDLQSGEVLAQLIEIISGENITGIQYNPESLQGMRENLERILKFMATKRIRMHQISSKEILEGNLKAVMRLILALAAHYKPQSVRHHDVSYENLDKQNSAQTSIVDRDGSLKKARQQKLDPNETQLNQTHDSVFSSPSLNTTVVKRTPSFSNDTSHLKRATSTTAAPTANHNNTAPQIYENLSGSQSSSSMLNSTVMTETMATQTEAKSPLQMQQQGRQQQQQQQLPPPALQKESSFVRTGSGRKLPKIPAKGATEESQRIGNSNTLPPGSSALQTMRSRDDGGERDCKAENRKSKPKALEFWESLETVDSSDFRYNTIHRMSMGRRMLPQPPSGAEGQGAGGASSSSAAHCSRSMSLDRSGREFPMSASSDVEADKTSLNSSFSGPTSLPASTAHSPQQTRRKQQQQHASDGDRGRERERIVHGEVIQHKSDVTNGIVQQQQAVNNSPPSPLSADSRGEVEGSSDNNSPPTSVIQGAQGDERSDPALEWLTGSASSFGNRQRRQQQQQLLQRNSTVASKEYLSHHEELSSEKFHPKFSTGTDGKGFHSLEQEVMLLRSLRIGDGNSNGSSKQSDSMSDSGLPTGGCGNGVGGGGGGGNAPYEVLLQDLTQAKRQLLELRSLECATLQGSKLGLQNRLQDSEATLGQLKQNLVRTTLAKQTLEIEKKEMLRKIEELEATVSSLKIEDKDKMNRSDFAKKQRVGDNSSEKLSLENERILYDEELAVAKDAISNLRTSFNESDPNQHILDTLEQCISVIIEKIQHLEQQDKHSSRLSSLDYARVNEGGPFLNKLTPPTPNVTKVLYFTNRSVTPFMSSINKRIGDITLRDFKSLFDRPGFFRFHFKAVDQEFGMVKEEISQDDAVLPGADGKVVAWVDED